MRTLTAIFFLVIASPAAVCPGAEPVCTTAPTVAAVHVPNKALKLDCRTRTPGAACRRPATCASVNPATSTQT